MVGNGSLSRVTQLGNGVIGPKHHPLHLNRVLLCPSFVKNLVSVRRFTIDNHCSVECDPYGFCVKDLKTKTKLLRCNSSGPLYLVTPTIEATPLALAASTTSALIWHYRLGHPGNSVLSSLSSAGSVTYNKADLTTLCHACQLGKHVCLPFTSSTSSVSAAFDIVHSDIWTSPVSSFGGKKYYVIFLDHFSNFVWAYPLRKKGETFAKYLHFSAFVRNQFKCTIKALQCDSGDEYNNRIFLDHLASEGTSLCFSCPHTSQKNGRAERMLRTINNLIRSLLFQAHMSPQFWVEALLTATHLLNILPSKSIGDKVLYTTLFARAPTYHHLRVFGCLCYPNLYATSRHKLAQRASDCAFLGYPSDHRGYRCLDLKTRKIIFSRHVTFDEMVFPLAPSTAEFPVAVFDPLPLDLPPLIPRLSMETTQTPTAPTAPLPPAQPTHPMVAQSKSGIVKPRVQLCLHTAALSPLPTSHVQALKDPNWNPAMQMEYDSQIKSGTWSLVPRLVATNVIRSMWLYRHKFDAEGNIVRHKARLVENGKSQEVGVDCDETFSPVVKPATIRTVLDLALARDWPLHQLDVKNAFLHGNLEETVYMHQPPGFVDPKRPNHVCLLKKSLYGLKQAPQAWYNRFATFVRKLGFIQSSSDVSLFIFCRGSYMAYLLLYVDDIILTSSSQQLVNKIVQALSSEFEMTDLGQLHYFLGIAVKRNSSGLFLQQQNYAAHILNRANMSACNPCLTPVDTKAKLAADDGPPVKDPKLTGSKALLQPRWSTAVPHVHST